MMGFLKFIRVLAAVSIPIVVGLTEKKESQRFGTEQCHKLEKDPFFETEMVIGRPWRIYYTWNINMDGKCMDMTFKNVTPMIVNRIYNDMYEYLENQPYWDAATLLVTMGRANHEMLLFADQGAAGRFIGVPNVVKDGNISPVRNTVPLLKFHLKLIHEGKYLLMTDCQIGVTTMSYRGNSAPYHAEIGGIASTLGDYGDGFPACTSDKNSNEQIAQ